MNRQSAICAFICTLLGTSLCALAHDALMRPTELQYWDSTHADNRYTFLGVGGTTYLLDMLGRVVHTWPVGNNPHLHNDGTTIDTTVTTVLHVYRLPDSGSIDSLTDPSPSGTKRFYRIGAREP